MSVSVEGGKGRGRKTNAELNLVPFIDLLSVQITFLLATAVLLQVQSLPHDQAIGDPNSTPPETQETPPPPPLTVHVRADGVWVGRKVEEGQNFPVNNDNYDWGSVDKAVMADRRAFPDTVEVEGAKKDAINYKENQVVVVTDDGVNYGHMIKALDITRVHGYSKSLLGGGPAQASDTRPRSQR